MPRLIDAEKLEEYKASGISELTEWQKGWNDAIDTIMNETPTVDAEPVRHGKWTHTKWSNMRHDYTCSLCGCRISGVDPFSLSATAYYYCPECGAKMDEVEDG